MAEHTHGPWAERALNIEGVVSENYREISGGAECEPQTDDPSRWGYECLRIVGYISPANARLIAAAPDLLALAKQYASECGECNGTGEVDGDPERDSYARVNCPDCADIRAVIAKAEGRA